MATNDLISKEQQAKQIVNKGRLVVNYTNQPIIDLEVIPGPESNATQLLFNWTCIAFTPNYMDFKLNW